MMVSREKEIPTMFVPYIISDLFENPDLDLDTLKEQLQNVYANMADENLNCIANVADDLIDTLRPYRAIYRASRATSTKHTKLIVQQRTGPVKYWLIK